MEYVYIGKPVYRVKDWGRNPSTMDVGCFYGGDLKVSGTSWIIYRAWEWRLLSEPCFVSPSNHKYDCQDYEHIDPHFGRIVKDGGKLVDKMERTTDRRSGM